MPQKLEVSDIEAFHYVQTARFSKNDKRIIVYCAGTLEDLNSFLLEHGYVTSTARESTGEETNLRVEYKSITEL